MAEDFRVVLVIYMKVNPGNLQPIQAPAFLLAVSVGH